MYQQTRLLDGDGIEPTPSKRARAARRTAQMQPPPRRELDAEEEDDFDMEFDDSFLRDVDVAAATATATHPRQLRDEFDLDEWDYVDDDSSFIRHVDEAEAQAHASTATTIKKKQTARPATTSRFFDRDSTRMATNDRTIYEVDSDGGSTKENRKPTDVVYISD